MTVIIPGKIGRLLSSALSFSLLLAIAACVEKGKATTEIAGRDIDLNATANPSATQLTENNNGFPRSDMNLQSGRHRSFSLRACFDKGDAENKEILVAASGLPVAQAAIIIAKAIPNPTYTMLYGFGNSFRLTVCANEQQVGFAEEIQVAGRRSKKIDVARANYLQTAFQLEAVRFDVHNRLRRAYAELAAAHAYADLTEAQSDIAKQLLDISQKRYAAGKAPGSEVLQARLAMLQFIPQQNQAWARVVQDSARMISMLGEAPLKSDIVDVGPNGLFKLSIEKGEIVPSPDHRLPQLEQILPVAWRERPDLKIAIQTAYTNRKSLTLAKTQRIPDPIIGFQYEFPTFRPFQFGAYDPQGVLPYLQGLYPNLASELTVTPTLANPATGLVKNLYWESLVNGLAAQSQLPIPDINKDRNPFVPGYLFTALQETPLFYQHQGEVEQAKAIWAQQLKQNDQLKAQIATDIVTAYEALRVARANINEFRTQILPAASRVALMTRRGYEFGKMDLATTMLAQQQYQQLLSSYFDSVVAYQNAWADVEKAVGLPLNL